VRLWDVAKGTELRVFRGHEHGVTSVGFTHDGHTLFTAGPDHTIRLWSLVDGRVRILRGHEDTIHEVALAPDGRLLGSASGDGTVRLWSTELPPSMPTGAAAVRAWLGEATTAEIDTVHPLESHVRPRS
jgi:WD40 repeat protein